MYCIFCGAQIPDDSSFCPQCGRALSVDYINDSKDEPPHREPYQDWYYEGYHEAYKEPVKKTPNVIYRSNRRTISEPRFYSSQSEKKYCKYCSSLIDSDCVVCPVCGEQLETVCYKKTEPSHIYVNNVTINQYNNTTGEVSREKWVAFVLCLFLGVFGAHRFYDRQTGMGILYLFTGGLFGFGVLIDLIRILSRPDPYYI